MLFACETPVTIGVEHRMTVAALAHDPATGEILQAGFRTGPEANATQSDLWFGRTDTTGTFLRPATTFDLASGSDAILAAARLNEGWVVAGHATDALGVRRGWISKLDDQEHEVWTVSLGRPGTQTSARAVGVAFDQSIVVGGIETQADGADDGWLARIDPDGGTSWRVSFAADFQQQASGSTVLGIGLVPPSISQIYTVGQRVRDGGVAGVALQLSLDGSLYNSSSIGESGAARSVFVDSLMQLTTCSAEDDGVIHVRTVDRAFTPSRELPLQLDGVTLLLAGCAQTAQTLWVGATAVHRDGTRAPYYARIDKASFTVRDAQELPVSTSTTVLAVQVDANGKAWLAGRGDSLLRRWMIELP